MLRPQMLRASCARVREALEAERDALETECAVLERNRAKLEKRLAIFRVQAPAHQERLGVSDAAVCRKDPVAVRRRSELVGLL